jgi:Ca2+-binding RTX toxin-like protein
VRGCAADAGRLGVLARGIGPRSHVAQLRRVSLAAIAALGAAGFSDPAQAATVELGPERDASPDLERDVVAFTASAGEVNTVTARHVATGGQDSGTWQITDATATLIAGAGCTRIDEHNASCTPATGRFLAGATFELGDGNDSLTTLADNTASGNDVLAGSGGSGDDRFAIGTNHFVSVSGDDGDDDFSAAARRGVEVHSLLMNGGPGNDRLDGSSGPEFLDGGGGEDVLFGRGGQDELTDGDRDTVDPALSPGPDRLDGGTGTDTVSYAKRTAAVSVDLESDAGAGRAGENDAIVRVESVYGGRGDDRLAGSARRNDIRGGRGADRILARGGDDSIDPGPGEDVVSCGPSQFFDYVHDPRRTTLVGSDCELVTVGSFRATYDPYPKRIDRDRLTFELYCPGPDDEEFGSPSSCAGSARLTTASAPHRVLAAAPIRRGPWMEWQRLQLALPLTAAGQRVADRRRGVRAVVRVHFRDGPGPREEPALFAWMIRLKLPP